MPDEQKIIYEDNTRFCPHCRKKLEIKLVRMTIKPATKGEYERHLQIQKNPQSTF